MFKKIKRKIKTKADFQLFLNFLIQCVKDDVTISNNKMLDGFMIGLIHCNSGFIYRLIFTKTLLPPSTDFTIQQLEQSILWLANNEDELYKLYETKI